MAFLQIYYGYGAKYHVRSDYEVLVHSRLITPCHLHYLQSRCHCVDQQHRREAESNDMSHDVSMHTDIMLSIHSRKHIRCISRRGDFGPIFREKKCAYTPENTVPVHVLWNLAPRGLMQGGLLTIVWLRVRVDLFINETLALLREHKNAERDFYIFLAFTTPHAGDVGSVRHINTTRYIIKLCITTSMLKTSLDSATNGT